MYLVIEDQLSIFDAKSKSEKKNVHFNFLHTSYKTLVRINFKEHEVLIQHLCFPQRDLFYPVRNWELDSVSETFFGFLSRTFRQKNHSRKKSVKIADATMQKGRTTQH